jgi:hypothetical protein
MSNSNRQAPANGDPYALALDTPEDLARLRAGARGRVAGLGGGSSPEASAPAGPAQPGPRTAATDQLAARTGALVDEVDFPTFVAGLVHGTFNAVVDASIRQMEAYADLVSAVAKDAEQFTQDNVTANQARDWLAQRHPNDLALALPSGPGGGEPRLRRRQPQAQDGETPPEWLADYGLEGEELTDELIEESLVPAARRAVGEQRLQTLATMVLMGMSRINVKDGTVAARVRFRAAARDKAAVDYAISQDPGGGQSWGSRGSASYAPPATMVSTVGVNVQADTELKAELFGEVRINFVSETLPLDRFVGPAELALLQRHARPGAAGAPPAAAAGGGEVPAPATAPVAPPARPGGGR